MQDCDRLSDCPFFSDRLADMPGTSVEFKRKYCRGAYETCARRMVAQAQGMQTVPADLFAGQRDKLAALVR